MKVIFDIDGTLADISHRLHFIKGEKKNWPAFYAACALDKPIYEMCRTAALFCGRPGITVGFITGREGSDRVRADTEDWLDEYVGRHANPRLSLYMRPKGDYRPDHVIKGEIADYMRDELDFVPDIVFEDRQQVVDMWRARGIRCCQVAPGDF